MRAVVLGVSALMLAACGAADEGGADVDVQVRSSSPAKAEIPFTTDEATKAYVGSIIGSTDPEKLAYQSEGMAYTLSECEEGMDGNPAPADSAGFGDAHTCVGVVSRAGETYPARMVLWRTDAGVRGYLVQ